MTTSNTQFLKKYSIYAIGNIGSKLIMFLLFPILTFYLTPEELGTFDFYFTIIIILGQISTLNLKDGLFRFLIKGDVFKNKIILQTFIHVLSCNIIILLFSACIFSIFNIQLAFNPFLLFLFFITFNFFEVYQQIIRATGKTYLYVIANLTASILTAVISIILLRYTSLKAVSLLIAYTVAKLIAFLIIEKYYPLLISAHGKRYTNNRLTKYLITYSLLLLPANLATSGIDNWAKIYIIHYLGEYYNGIYAITLKFCSIFYIFTVIYQQAWQETALREYKSNNKNQYFSNFFNTSLLLLSIGASIFIIGLYFIYPYVIDPQYYSSFKYIYPQLIGIVFLALSFFLNLGYECTYQVNRVLYSSLIAVGVSLSLNFYLIPHWGLIGCMISNLIAYSIMFLYRIIDTKKYFHIRLNKKGLFGITLITITSIGWIIMILHDI